MPNFESIFLNDLYSGLKKRRKAIKYYAKNFTIEKVWLKEGENIQEVLEFTVSVYALEGDMSLKFDVYDCRFMSLVFWSKASKKTVWSWKKSGTAMPSLDGKKFINNIELSIAKRSHMQHNYLNQFDEIWGPFIYSGLKPVG